MKKKIILTGGSGNLGRFLIKNFAKKNYKIYNLSRKRPVKMYANEIFMKCELSKFDEILNSLKEIKMKDRIDIIISAAGKSKKNYEKTVDDLQFISSIYDNLISFTNLVEGYLKIFGNKKVKIIAISSIAGVSPIDAPINYSVSKSALNYYCLIKAKQLSKFKININTISPGNILMNNNNWGKMMKSNSEKVKKYIKKAVPLNSFCKPEAIFEMCLLLSNKSGDAITGSNFIVDGGQSI